ncbi:hypothetical protein EIKCOROL_00728 [Eikenella corrodens ATCC 23834]|uniref:Uncharacterized protein n=1 Tax=Eikenella corrodens ATCC 23834 TaxID=546274 RepID=C0DTP7_EIKCO|nr:hypothetical protein EIKCOROL_00728 [Eikenella corrodens ATCC 23834]
MHQISNLMAGIFYQIGSGFADGQFVEVGDGGQQLADAADTYVVGAAEGLGLAHGCVLLFVRKGLIVDWAAAAGKGLMFR